MSIGVRLGIGAALVTGASAAFAANLPVCPTGCRYATIQSAIDAAADGDVIQIAKGRYVENLVIVAKRVTLQGADKRTTIVDGNGQGAVITIGRQATVPLRTSVSLTDLTITRGYASGGGGITVFYAGSLTLRHSIVTGNHSTGDGGGINVFSDEPVTIADSSVTNNSAEFWGGGIFATGEDANVSIARSTFAANSASQGFGGGIALLYDASNLSVTDTEVADNSAHQAGGIYGGSGAPHSHLTVQNVVVSGNTAATDSGGMWIAGIASMSHVVVAHNTAATSGGGMSTVPGFRGGGVTLNDVYIVQNKAGTIGGGIANDGGLVVQSGVVVAANQPDNCAQASTVSGCP
jgi:hypothetical protein